MSILYEEQALQSTASSFDPELKSDYNTYQEVSRSSYQRVNAIGQHHQNGNVWLPIKEWIWLVGSWSCHVTHLHGMALHLLLHGASQYYVGATQYISIATRVLHRTSLLLRGCYTVHLYCYAGATPYISIATRVLHRTSLLLRRCYTIHLYCYAGATPYISIAMRVLSLLLHSATTYIYCYAGATSYISITMVLHLAVLYCMQYNYSTSNASTTLL